MTPLRSHLWQRLTREEIRTARDRGVLVAMPVGAIEQHGPHLSVETDALLCASVTSMAAERASVGVLVAPTLPFGFSPHHLSHPGTISLRLATYFAVLSDVARSIVDIGFPRLVLVNGHGGNSAPLRAKVAELVTDGVPVTAVDYWAPAEEAWIARLKGVTKRFGHACEFETSLMLALARGRALEEQRMLEAISDLAPRTVQPWIPDGESPDPVTEFRAAWPPIFQGDDVGYFGDPRAATAETGAEILDILVARLAAFFEAFASTALRMGKSVDRDAPLVSPPLKGKSA